MKKILILLISLFFINNMAAQGWGQTQKIVASDRELAAEFGYAVAMDGDYAVIGAKDDNNPSNNEGSAYVFQNDGNGNWTEIQKLSAPDKNLNDRFGYSVAMHDNTIIVGAISHDFGGSSSTNTDMIESSGAAYIYEKNSSGTWDFVFKAVAPDRESTFDVFGEAVAVSGNYAVVAAQGEDEDENGLNTEELAGAAYIFERNGNGDWSFVQKIVTLDRITDDRLGRNGSVSIDGDTIVIGAEAEDEDENGLNTLNNAGSVYVFERDGTGVWNQTQKIVASNRAFGYNFGKDVAIDGDFMVVGSSASINFDGGPAYVFKKTGGIWQEIQQLEPSNINTSINFGKTVDIEGDRLVVGSYTEELSSFGSAGAAYVFEKDGNDSWNQVARIGALDAEASDRFSLGIAISGDFIIGGAYWEDEDENGQNPLSQSGSAYVFDVNEPNTIPNTLSVVENTFSSVIKAYPNPTENMLNIDLGSNSQEVNVLVYTILGQQVFSKNYTNSKTIQLDIQNQPKGLYLVEVSMDGGASSVIKIIKQ